MQLSAPVIHSRMQEWRNLKVLHGKQNKRIERLEAENKVLKAENAQLRAVVASQAADIQSLKLQIEELRTIIFGKKKKQVTADDEELPSLILNVAQPRTPDSYRRKLPNESDVTKRVRHSIRRCTEGHVLTNRTCRIFYTHDIPALVVPEITEHTIEAGYCARCKKHLSAIPLPPAAVIFGGNLRRLVATLSSVHRLSHPQIQSMLALHFNTTVSDGEVAKMVAKEAEKLRPELERLKSSIQLSDIRQIDETSWQVCLGDAQGKFCWIVSDALSAKRIYSLGRSRGKGNADDLLGEKSGVVVSDDYGAYRKLPNHQLCFAHLARDLRDLAQSPSLEKHITDHCRDLSRRLSHIYRDVDTHRDPALEGYFTKRLHTLAFPLPNEPAKLATLKTTLRKNISKYLTGLRDPRIPLTNNRAERDLRHVVLKRNVSFGSRNAKGAEHTGILLSCLMTRKAEGTLGDYLRGV